MSYRKVTGAPERDPLFRQYSPYVADLPRQPTRTTCLAAAFDAVRRAIDAAGAYVDDDLSPIVAPFVDGRGWAATDLATAVSHLFPQYIVRPVRGPSLVPSHAHGYVVLVPGPPGQIGHALAVTHQDPGLLWDPWARGRLRVLGVDELSRWRAGRFPAIEIRLRRPLFSGG